MEKFSVFLTFFLLFFNKLKFQTNWIWTERKWLEKDQYFTENIIKLTALYHNIVLLGWYVSKKNHVFFLSKINTICYAPTIKVHIFCSEVLNKVLCHFFFLYISKYSPWLKKLFHHVSVESGCTRTCVYINLLEKLQQKKVFSCWEKKRRRRS